MKECLFCKIAAGDIPADKVYEDEHTLVFRDIDPKAPVHLLVIPKKHYAGIHLIPPEETGIMQQLMATVSHVVAAQSLTGRGYRLVINFGDEGGQTVHHIHIHILGGRAMQWPPG